MRPYRGGTGYWEEGSGPILGGTGLAGHRPSDNPEVIIPASSDEEEVEPLEASRSPRRGSDTGSRWPDFLRAFTRVYIPYGSLNLRSDT